MLSEVGSKLLFSQCLVASRDNFCVGFLHRFNVLLNELLGLVLERVGSVNVHTNISRPHFPIQNLVKFLENLAETSLVQLYVGLEFTELNIEADDALLQHDARRVHAGREQDGLVSEFVNRCAVPPLGSSMLGGSRHIDGLAVVANVRKCPPPTRNVTLRRLLQSSSLVLIAGTVVHVIVIKAVAVRANGARVSIFGGSRTQRDQSID